MSRKSNLEESVLNYFTTAPLAHAELMLRIASGTVKRRQGPRLSGTAAARSARKALAAKQTESEKLQGRLTNAPQPV